jgi:hypothetical protein
MLRPRIAIGLVDGENASGNGSGPEVAGVLVEHVHLGFMIEQKAANHVRMHKALGGEVASHRASL